MLACPLGEVVLQTVIGSPELPLSIAHSLKNTGVHMLNRVLYLSCINVHTLLSCTSTYTDRIRQKSNSNRLKNDVLQSLSLNISYCMTTRSLNGSVAL